MMETPIKMIYQNQRKTKIFSLITFRAMMHKAGIKIVYRVGYYVGRVAE